MRKPWWETYPREYWTATDLAAARKAGVVPPLPKPHIDPALMLLAEQTPKTAVIGGLYGDPDARREKERRRKADDVLEAHGIRPRRLTRGSNVLAPFATQRGSDTPL